MNNNLRNYKDAVDEIKTSDELREKVKSKNVKKKNTGFYKLATVMCACLITFSIGALLQHKNLQNIGEVDYNEIKNPEIAVQKTFDLPVIGTLENYKEIAKVVEKEYESKGFGEIFETMTDSMVSVESSVSDTATNSVSRGEDYSKTNIQVEGVDEADIIKTNGKYIFYRNGNKNSQIVVVDTETQEIVNEINLKKDNTTSEFVREMFIDGDKLIAIISANSVVEVTTKTNIFNSVIDYAPRETYTKAIVYDFSNINDIFVYRTLELEGTYKDSRLINHKLYMIATNSPSYYDVKDLTAEDIAQGYRDSFVSTEYREKTINEIYYFPDAKDKTFMNVSVVDIESNKEMQVESFLGAGNTLYMNTENMFIATTKYMYPNDKEKQGNEFYKTLIYKISLENGLTYMAQTELDGTIDSQFSMDEYDSNLRIALTSYKQNEESDNNLYVLDKELNVIGKVEDLAVGEKIYSVRFIGNKGYIVTFKQIDPLFVIDLSNPEKPEVKGELKIPGYSSYLHPYDENHIIGIGYDTVSNGFGGVTNSGVKLSLFNISDMSNPVEVGNLIIGDRGTYSLATDDHKAVMFSKEKNMLAIPINISEDYYTTFRGAMCFEVDLEKGFKELGRMGSENSRIYNYPERIIYVGDYFYIGNSSNITIYDMKTYEEVKVLEFTSENKYEYETEITPAVEPTDASGATTSPYIPTEIIEK